MERIVLATRNQGKVRELAHLLAKGQVEVLSLADFPEIPEIIEDGQTFAENATKKALAVAKATGLIALADDSGLEVDALGGAPGVFSARFAGEPTNDEANNKKLLSLLAGVPEEKRTARFRCVIAIATPVGEVFLAEGKCEGRIAFSPRGKEGFGYDPLFLVPELNKTFAELDLETKGKISHRGKALARAMEILEELLPNC